MGPPQHRRGDKRKKSIARKRARHSENETEEVQRWGELHDSVVEKILSYIPVPKLLQFRSVCKHWKRMIDSPQFRCLRHQVPSTTQTSFLVLQLCFSHAYMGCDWISLHNNYFAFNSLNIRVLRIFNPLLNSWYTFPPSVLTRGEIFSRSYHRGLWCIQLLSNGGDGDMTQIMIHNPTSGWIKEVPSSINPKLKVLISLVVEKESSNFKLISSGCTIAGCTFRQEVSLHTQVYDSVTNRWKSAGNLPNPFLQFKTDGYLHVMYAVADHYVYYIVGRSRRTQAELDSSDIEVGTSEFHWNWFTNLLAFDLNDYVWKLVPGDLPFEVTRRSKIKLFERNGALVLVELAQTEEREWKMSIGWKPRIYSWDRQSSPDMLIWTEIAVTPPPTERQFQKLFYHQRGHEYAGLWAGQGDCIVFFSGTFWGHRALLYNISSRIWTVSEFGPKRPKRSKWFMPLPFDLSLNR
ncbi:hypothetical protein MPTK1_4g14590 [Marchantia polymorpha subsp. ruderalis]|uniref:F-box domain-containing protein n=2 Tax=Marchantia polymorpha TaxID=3197 RepID=A0AAF6B9W8_MARPO|nr:hypothetical protein MARPO_0070s0022 [Marchantia polymorpha]BBN08802.1 hypothetical protein Mp_4g14590 [Marchantia polymorpha subsp. ruderalis]|eukprot:PTQ35550.1 hypothetical protein MARPO_0070s0022 [Marchantia polymorpha]